MNSIKRNNYDISASHNYFLQYHVSRLSRNKVRSYKAFPNDS